jgi:hypothetical protein
MVDMMLRTIAIGTLIILNGAAYAQGPVADPWRPSNYVQVPAPGFGSSALGFDALRWTYWQTDTDTRGNMYGFDAHGNYWTYNRKTSTSRYYAIEPRWQARCYTSVTDMC